MPDIPDYADLAREASPDCDEALSDAYDRCEDAIREDPRGERR